MKKTPTKPFNYLLIFLLVAACLAACALFTFLPPKAFDTGIVYQEF